MECHTKVNEQIKLDFDSSGFEAFKSTQHFFAHASLTIRDNDGRVITREVQAMEMDRAPSHWNHKCNETNNTSVNLNDADAYTELYGDTRWIHFAVWKHIIQAEKEVDIERLERELAEARRLRDQRSRSDSSVRSAA